MAKIKCDVCGAEFEGNICQQCGWTPMILPASAPEALKKLEADRVAKMKRAWEKAHSLQSTVDNANNEAAEAKEQLQEWAGRCERLQAEIKELQEKSKTASNISVKGIVYIKNTQNEEDQYLPIFPGSNTYGTDPETKTHHRINLTSRVAAILPKHFMVKCPDDKDMKVQDLSNGRILFNYKPFVENKPNNDGKYIIEKGKDKFEIIIKKF